MTDTNFLPDNYEIPTKPYFKFIPGDNRIRILASPIIGYEYFTNDNKPVRSKESFDEMPSDIKPDGAIKHFWAMKIWNYHTTRIEIMEITQKGILTAIKSLAENPKWGTPLGYDICITKKGEGLNTEYTVIPEPKSELTEVQELAFADTYVNLEALYTNGDPFIKG
jgi:hypothetical protein